MPEKPVGVGIVGAGANTRSRHIPGLRAIPGVEIVGVVNRTSESSARVAQEFGIPKTYANWRAVIEDPQVDAVCIGTWPDMHCEITCAALAAGKHVLTEARMARNAAEAHRMQAAALAQPGVVAQIVPSPFGLVQEPFIHSLLKHSYIGQLREVVVLGADSMFWDYTEPLHWRQDVQISGVNLLALGILHETVSRWIPPTIRVFAQTNCFERQRPLAGEPGLVDVTVPDSAQIVTLIEGGARGIYHMSGITLFGPGKQIHLYGSRGTIKYVMTPQEQLFCGRPGDSELEPVNIPEDQRGGWRVEAEFIAAVRGQDKVHYTDFATGVRYMEFTEAVARSAALNLPVDLPLKSLA
ncbi:MAG TPA: Gfo/Idh/MocA family oxidoreductase [Planctomycetaceae bacterium]|nr:Gfo/Idh/MocA family oxidoreductase [Planctomycetaceae bacterium]